MEKYLYHYRAYVNSVYDGDTITVEIDLGFNIVARNEKIRLFGINAPEMRGSEKEEGKKSRDYLRSLILGKEIILETKKDKKGKYGRYLGTIWISKNGKKYININKEMVFKGFAVEKDY